MREIDGTLRKPADINLHFTFFDNTMEEPHYRNNIDISRILRRRAYVDELGVPAELEFDGFDGESRHVLGSYGDAPACYARWRVNDNAAIIDRVCTLHAYRYRGVARKCLQHVAHDVLCCASRLKLTLHGLVLLVPQQHSTIQQKLAEASFISLDGSVGPLSCVRMCLPISQIPLIRGIWSEAPARR